MWVWVNSGRWWKTEKPGEMQSMELQRVGYDLETEQQQFVSSLWSSHTAGAYWLWQKREIVVKACLSFDCHLNQQKRMISGLHKETINLDFLWLCSWHRYYGKQQTPGMITYTGRVGGPSASTNDFSQRSDGSTGSYKHTATPGMDTSAGPRTAELALGPSGGMEASGGVRSWLPLPKASFRHSLRFQRDWLPNQPLLLGILQGKINKIHCRARMKGSGSERCGCTAHFVLWALGCGQVVSSLRVVRGPWFKEGTPIPVSAMSLLWDVRDRKQKEYQLEAVDHGRAEHCCEFHSVTLGTIFAQCLCLYNRR